MVLRQGIGLFAFLAVATAASAQSAELANDGIAAQPLADAIQEFVDETGLQVVYESDIANDKFSQGSEASSNEEMLDQLLAKTGIDYVFLNANTVALQEKAASDGNAVEKSRPASSETLMAQNQTSASQTPSSQTQFNQESDESQVHEEIIVTAQIREESLQDVPVSGTAFTGAALEDNRLVDIDDIARFTPGLTGSFFNYSSPIIAVRGANNTFSQAGASKPVGVFLDDVFIPRYSASSFELFDLQQVTILRGPQGTLFGRNVTGGAIQVTSAQPKVDENEFSIKAGVGNHGLEEFAGYAAGGLSDNIAGKLSVSYRNRDGFAVDRFSGQELEDLDSINVRAGLVFFPTDDVEIRLAADFSRDESGGRSFSFLSSSDGSDLTGNDGDNRTAELRVPQSYERDISGLSAHLTWGLAKGRFQSITAHRQSDAHEIYSLGAADVKLPSVSTQFLKDEVDEPGSFSQEFRYISDRFDNFDFVTGLYYYTENTDRFVGDVLLGVNGNAVFVDRSFDVKAETRSVAAYASVTFHIGDKFDIGLGGRYTKEEKDVTVDFADDNNATNNFLVSPSNDFSEFTPRITLTYYPSESVTLFASRTEGFTAGGFNTETNNATAIRLGFEPETIVAYEIGAKTTWADGRVVANLTLFDQEYEDKQEGFFTPAGPYFSIFNASKATMTGAELELSWAVTGALSMSTTYSTLGTEYDSFVIPLGADYTGNKLQTAPEGKFSLAFDYVKDIAGGKTLFGGLSYSWQDDYYTGASNSPDFLIESYSLLNARFGIAWSDGRWRADFWGKNLADEDFVRIRGNSGALAEYFGPPRTYGISVTYQSL